MGFFLLSLFCRLIIQLIKSLFSVTQSCLESSLSVHFSTKHCKLSKIKTELWAAVEGCSRISLTKKFCSSDFRLNWVRSQQRSTLVSEKLGVTLLVSQTEEGGGLKITSLFLKVPTWTLIIFVILLEYVFFHPGF